MKKLQLGKALSDLAEEGVTQLFRPMIGADWIVGVVGQLQLEVLSSRIASEYGVPIAFESVGYETARWATAEDKLELKRFVDGNRSVLAEDKQGRRPGPISRRARGICSAWKRTLAEDQVLGHQGTRLAVTLPGSATDL